MAKKKKPDLKDKEAKKKLKDIQTEYHKNLPESERNPTHESDFDAILNALVNPKKKGK